MPLNQCNFIGNLTRDCEMRHLDSGTTVTQFGLAINHKWKDKNGDAKEEVTFIDCEAWGKTGEIISQYTNKGSQLFVTCRAKLEQWSDKEGQKRSKMKFVVEQFTFIGGRQNAGEEGQGESRHGTENQDRQQSKPAPPPAKKPPATTKQWKSPPIPADENDDNIPF